MDCTSAYLRITGSDAETRAFASTLAPLLRAGDVVLLNGPMGAGKTRFVQGVAAALGSDEAVVSPTFNIVLGYRAGGIELYHFDLYRLEDEGELEDIGYWELLEAPAVSFVEWGDKFPGSVPEDYVELRFSIPDPQVRSILCRAHGPRARALLEGWASDARSRLVPCRRLS